MDFMKWRSVLIWVLPVGLFALCWAWAATSWGDVGLYVGWIPAMIVGRLSGVLTSLVWTVIALTLLLAWHFHAGEHRGSRDQRSSV